MSVHTISSREFTRDVAAAKQWSANGPVFITDRGAPAHVLLTIDEYRRLTGVEAGPTLLQAMDTLPASTGAELDLTPRQTSAPARQTALLTQLRSGRSGP